MSRNRIVTAVVAALSLWGCSRDRAVIDISLPGMAGEKLVLTRLDVSRNVVVDTIVCGQDGKARYRVQVPEDGPDFFYLASPSGRLASLVLSEGDRVRVVDDGRGGVAASGSEECRLMMQADSMYAGTAGSLEALSDRLVANAADVARADGFRREMGRIFAEYYREAVYFVMSHPASMASVSVLFQKFGDNLNVFSSDTDVAHFRMVRDSIAARYPRSRYLGPLDSEIRRRENALTFRMMVGAAEQVGYPDLVLPDVVSRRVQLSSLKEKVVIVHFWSASDNVQKMYNLDVLRPVYDKYRGKGLQIYQVSLDADKGEWARTVSNQGLEWINVNGSTSSAASYYQVTELPSTFIIADGGIVERGWYSLEALDAACGKYLK